MKKTKKKNKKLAYIMYEFLCIYLHTFTQKKQFI